MKAKSTNKQAQKQSMNPASLSPSQLKSRQNQLIVIDVRGWLEYLIGAYCWRKENEPRSHSQGDS